MSERELDRFRELAKLATPGPWVIDDASGPHALRVDAPAGDPLIGYRRWDDLITCWGCEDEPEEGAVVARRNAEFVAAARTAVPVLLADLDAAINAIHDLQQESAAYSAGMQVERSRWRNLVRSRIPAERLKAGPVRGLEWLLDGIPGPERNLPPDRLRAENARLRQALERVLELHDEPGGSWIATADAMKDEARRALEDTGRQPE